MLARALGAVLCLAVIAGCTSGEERPAAGDRATKPPATPAPQPLPGALGPEFFGMHDSDPVGESWPDAPVGSLRVWDSGAVWNQIETAPGTYDFSRLDEIVKTARKHDAEILIVLGQTPTFYASRPKRVGSYGPGASSMPDLDAWKAYVRAVAQRYPEPDVSFQVWNEANVEGYWSGTPRQMAKLTLAAREVLDEVGSTQTLVAPAMATRLLFHRAYFLDFYRQRVGGRPVWDLVDVFAFQLYPEHDAPVERSMELLEATRILLGREGVPADKPIWNTEINYGLKGGDPATPLPEAEQAANVARTYVLNAAYDVERVYWYSWDLQQIANTSLVAADGTAATSAGRAVAQVRSWLMGTLPKGCVVTDNRTYVCTFEAPGGEERTVFWNPKREAEVRTAFDARALQPLGTPTVGVPLGGTTFSVGNSPVLVIHGTTHGPALPPRV